MWSYSASNLNTTTASGRPSKVCNQCFENKNLLEYNKNASSKDGFYSLCKVCKRARDTRYRSQNKKQISKKQKIYYQNNKEVYFQNNASRRSVSRKAKPSWLTGEQKREMLYKYSLAKECSQLTGEKYHVDHIIPLKGKGVCGLHVPWNLQVIPSDINSKKYNKFNGGW